MYFNEGGIWILYVSFLKVGVLYGYRVDGEYVLEKGFFFNNYKLLLDFYV